MSPAGWALLPIALALALPLAGCLTSKVRLGQGVLAYDHVTSDTLSQQLLLNIARARHNLPIHFTSVSSIAATYKVGLSGGVGPAVTGDTGFLVRAVPGRRLGR